MTEPNKQEFVSASKDANKRVTESEALEALDNLDDYTKMATRVDPIGPRETLCRFIEQNKQPTAEAGGEVAWMIVHDGICVGFVPNEEPNTIPVYTSQTTATQAAVAAAMRKCAEIAKSWGKSPATGEPDATALAIEEEIRSSIPAEATAALEKICMEVAYAAVDLRANSFDVADVNLRAIVRDVLNKNREE